jgi:hypothetical protein
MITRQLTTTLAHAAMLVAGTVFGAWLLAAPPAGALNDTQQLLAGGDFVAEGVVTLFTSPGLARSYDINTPGIGLGESAAQLRMPGGVLSALKVKLTTATAPSSGTFSVSVRINGGNTLLTCQIAATGTCNAIANVTVANNSRLAVRVSNTFIGAGNMGYSYTLLFN